MITDWIIAIIIRCRKCTEEFIAIHLLIMHSLDFAPYDSSKID